ncbi:CamS family sex pheromone protein [Leuconostoc fallax]|uniref:CamS family sex pheromone protein n=1 Tax=Leuconostoc fallax TaxID=1251 RepID=UPI002090FE95|nr:CamS family sex pheromone protein [Leuconostoc fallax]MCO6184252.1 CamS family sex pheromone protein [Leuconostoc fallax]
MKRIGFRGYVIIAISILIIALLSLYIFNMNRITPTSRKTSSVQVTSSSGDGDYQTVIKNGRYLTSKARGITAGSEANSLDTKHFESGLLSLAKNHFKTNQYVFQEGQYLSSDTVTSWLSRSSDDKVGLNPADNGKKDSDREPIYVQSLTEQDFMIKSGDSLKLSGMVIGVAMNTQDQYQREKYGATYTQDISTADMKAYGKKIAPKIISRIRQLKGISDSVPIVLAMYANAPADSLTPGNFYAEAKSTKGTDLSEWQSIDQKSIVLPKLSTDTSSLGSDENNGFSNFKTEIQDFFPNIAGATAVASFKNGQLTNMNVTITTQFYSQTEISSFANFVAQEGLRYLPSNVPIRMVIKTSNETQAILQRNKDDKTFKITVLD